MVLIVLPSLLSKRPWARIRARCEASFFIVRCKSARCCSVRGRTYLTLIALEIGFTYRMVVKSIHLRRDSLSSITYSEELISATISATLQSTDRHYGIVGQERCHFQCHS